MGFFDFLRRSPPIADRAALAEFLDTRTAFLVQKIVWEYCRARSAVGWQQLFAEESFKQAVDRSVWTNYPIGMGWVAETVLVTLREATGHDAPALAEGLVAAIGEAASRHPVPSAFDGPGWAAELEAAAERVRGAALLPPRAVRAIPERTFGGFFGSLPVHADLRRNDRGSILNGVKAILCNIHDEFVRRADRETVAAALAAPARPERTGT